MSHLLAHPKTKADLDAIVTAPRACYMLVGPRYSGKLASALYVAEKLHSSMFNTIRIKPNDKGSITIEMAHQVVESLSKKANQKDATRVVIIESAECMTIAAQNALLKVIEEPPANTIFLLLLNNRDGVLSTITSRCQAVYIRPVKNLPELARGRAGLVMEQSSSGSGADIQTDIRMDIQKDIQARAHDIMSASPFERMLLVDKLSSDKDQAEVIDWLAYTVSQAVRSQNATSQSLQSMQNYFIYSNAKVASKHALTEMMIRL